MKKLYTFGAFVVAGLTLLGAPASGQDSLRVFPPGTGRVFATEDTLPDTKPAYSLDPIDVRATRVPLIEIIRKARDGEKRKYEGLSTLAYNQTLKIIMSWGGRKPRTRCEETIQRVYFRAPHDWTVVTLKESTYDIDENGNHVPPGKKDEKINVEVTSGRRKDFRKLTEIPYYLERLDNFRFAISSRTLNPTQVLYEVDFQPLSDFNNLPGGRMWLLTPNYQIVREEFNMKHRPFPWIIKNIDLLTREWQEIEGRWVEKRITGRVDLGMNFMKLPNRVEFVMNFDQYRFDPVLDEKIFNGGDR
jgi:hypothetical protein